jgi:hypothetical protein
MIEMTWCSGQIPHSKIDASQLKTFLKILSSDSLEGRGTGSIGQKKAERVIVNRFRELGLSVGKGQNDFLETFILTQSYWGEVYVKTSGTVLRNFENMTFQGSNHINAERDLEIVFAGWGSDQELNQVEVNGRLVMVFVKNLRSSYEINQKLSKRNAAGVVIANPESDVQFESVKKSMRDFVLQKRLSLATDTIKKPLAKWDTMRFINTITIPNSEIRGIVGCSQRELLRMVKENRIADLAPVKAKVKFEWLKEEMETSNVVGVIKGRSDKAIVISAHFDHLGKTESDVFPGADDNGSGSAALLELAEVYASAGELPYSMVFLATSAEEAGLLGSTYHVNHPDFNPEQVLCNVNLDMISRKDDTHTNGRYLYVIGTDQSSALDQLVRTADALDDNCFFDYSLNNSTDPSGIFTRSDQYSFFKRGIPAIQFFSGLHADYHQATDTADKIDYKNFENRVRQISLVIELLQKEGL